MQEVLSSQILMEQEEISPCCSSLLVGSKRACPSDTSNFQNWTFSVTVKDDLLPSEILAISGNCEELGNWKPDCCILLNRQKGSNEWKRKIQLPYGKKIEYRYLICVQNSDTGKIIVRRWESHEEPRKIEVNERGEGSNDEFGWINGVENHQRGWLTSESILQLKIFNDTFNWGDNKSFTDVRIKVTPMSMERSGLRPNFIPIEPSSKAIVECVKFEYGNSHIRPQDELGVAWKSGDIVIFHITVHELKKVAYLLEVFGNEDSTTGGDDSMMSGKRKFPQHLGYYYLLPEMFRKSEGELRLPICNSQNHQQLGTINLSYLLINPLPSLNLNLRTTSTKFWKSHWTGLDIGHRGSGVSFRVSDMFYPENTLASMKTATQNGADMIELDVHVTKDGIPIVYHDFHVNICPTILCPRYGSDLIPVLIKDLTYEELNNFKIYHLLDGMIKRNRSYDNCPNPHEYNLFPKLEDVLQAFDPHVGFDIEIKWPQQLIDGSWESQQTIDKNSFLDSILEVVLRKGHGRCIVLTCFDADICTMMRFKQNIYPVLFLTLGPTERYPLYMDPRCNSIEMAICNAQAMEFLGIVPHTEDLLKDSKLVELVKKQNQVIFCWGDDSRDRTIVDKLKRMGLDGIIYDRVNEIIGIQNKRKIFFIDANGKENGNGCNEFYKYQFVELSDNKTNSGGGDDGCGKNGDSKRVC